MKKILLSLIFIVAINISANAILRTETEYNASGDTAATVTLDDQAPGKVYMIYAIYADSDTLNSTCIIQKANTTGVTTGYTTVSSLPMTNTSTYSWVYGGYGLPIFVGDPNYRYKIVASSTAANSLAVTYEIK